jgi:hypothetical protein
VSPAGGSGWSSRKHVRPSSNIAARARRPVRSRGVGSRIEDRHPALAKACGGVGDVDVIDRGAGELVKPVELEPDAIHPSPGLALLLGVQAVSIQLLLESVTRIGRCDCRPWVLDQKATI